MTRSRQDIVAYALPSAVVVAFAILLAFSLATLARIEQDMRDNVGENMLWVLTQAEIAGLRLDEEVSRRTSGDVETTDLELRYNVLLSRLKLLSQGPQARYLDAADFGEAIAGQAAAIRALEPLLAEVRPGARAVSSTIHDALQPLNALLGRAANAAMIATWEQSGARLDRHRNAVRQIIGAAIGILLSGLFLSASLMRNLGKARSAEHSLRKERDFTNRLINSSSEGIVALDADLRCTLLNPGMEKLFGVSASRGIGKTITDISDFFAGKLVTAGLREALDGEDSYVRDQTLASPADSAPRYLDISCFPLRLDGEVGGVIVFVRDVTERNATQRALAHHSNQLEQLVRDRTRELENTAAALESALNREQSVSEFYRSFAAMVSHQFRTPLAIIDSGVQRLARRSGDMPPSEIIERTTRIRSAVAKMSALVDSTLRAARIDAERNQVTPEQRCDVVMLLRDVCAHQQAVAPGRRIDLDFHAGAPLVAKCDPVLVEQIVANLLSNALKYSPSETAVALEVWADDGSIHCAVSDNGVGIPPDEARHLFDRFFRASTAGNVAGTGLGLNLARHLARIHDGDVTVESLEGAGSTFTMRLPCAGPPQSETQTAS